MLQISAEQLSRLDAQAETAFRARLAAHCRAALGERTPADLAARLEGLVGRARAAGLRHAGSLAIHAVLALELGDDPFEECAMTDGELARRMRDPAALRALDARLAAARRTAAASR